MKHRVIILALIALATLHGCAMEERVVRDDFATLRELGDQTNSKPTALEGEAPTTHGYAILVQRFEGSKHHSDAQKLAKRLGNDLFVPDVWVSEEEKFSTVYRGRYPDPTVDNAARDLRQTRMLRYDGGRPFAGASLVSLDVRGSSAADGGPLDLRQHRGMYSLQIGFYDKEYGPEFRQAAEKAAKVLRDEGNEAYFYHGRYLSLVTIGVFSDRDMVYVDNVANYGPVILELQKKFPYNLGNGLTLVDNINGEKREQPSFLVKVE